MPANKAEIQILLRAIDRTNNAINKVGRQVQNLSASQSNAARVGERLRRVQSQLHGRMAVGVGIISRLSTALFSLAAAYAAVRAASSALAPAIETEQFETQFAVLLRSFEAAQDRLRDLQEFNKSTPFELPELVQASKTLETLTKGALSAGDGLRLVADVAVATGQPFQELALHIGRAYDGLRNGRPVGEALLRLQELGVVSGETRTEIERLQKAGADGQQVWNVLAKEFERFRGLTELGSKTFSGAASNLSDTFRQLRENFSTPARDALTPILEGISKHLDELSESDKTAAAGEAVAAFLSASAAAFEEGRFSDFIGLSIEAGFEQGALAFRRIVSDDVAWYSRVVPRGIANALISGYWIFHGELVRNLATIPFTLKAVNDALVKKMAFELREAAGGIGHSIIQGILEGIQTGLRQITAPLEGIAKALRIPSLVNNRVFRELDSAIEKLDTLAKKSRLLQERNTGPALGELITIELAQANDQLETTFELLDESVESMRKLAKIRGESADETERELTASKKLLELIERQKVLLAEAKAKRQEEKDEILRQNQSPDKPDSDDSSDTPVTVRANPAERMAEQIQRFQEITTAAATVLHGVFNGISQSIEGLINGTMRWGDALRNIAGSIVQSIIRAFADMAAAYIVNQVLIRSAMKVTALFGSGIRKAEAADTIATESAKTPVLAKNATFASIGSFGAAAIIGLALVTAAIAAIAGGFQKGGHTGDGPEDRIAGVVHGKEFVAHAQATRAYGPELAAMNRGEGPATIAAMLSAKSPVQTVLVQATENRRTSSQAYELSRFSNFTFQNAFAQQAERRHIRSQVRDLTQFSSSTIQDTLNQAAARGHIRPQVVDAMVLNGTNRHTALHTIRGSAPASQPQAANAPARSDQPARINVAVLDDRQSVQSWLDSTEGRRELLRLSQEHSTELGV